MCLICSGRVRRGLICHGTHHRTRPAQSWSTPSTWQCVMIRLEAVQQHVPQGLLGRLNWRLCACTVARIPNVWYRMPVCCRRTSTTLPNQQLSSALQLATRRDMDLQLKSDGCRVSKTLHGQYTELTSK